MDSFLLMKGMFEVAQGLYRVELFTVYILNAVYSYRFSDFREDENDLYGFSLRTWYMKCFILTAFHGHLEIEVTML